MGNVVEALPTTPQDFDARLAVGFASQEAAELGEPTGGEAEGGWCVGQAGGLLSKGEEGVPLGAGQGGSAGRVRAETEPDR